MPREVFFSGDEPSASGLVSSEATVHKNGGRQRPTCVSASMASGASDGGSGVSAAGARPRGPVSPEAEGGRGEVRGLPGATEDKDGGGQEEETGKLCIYIMRKKGGIEKECGRNHT